MVVFKMNLLIICLLGLYSTVLATIEQRNCLIPKNLQRSWFSWEIGLPLQTVIDATSLSRHGDYINVKQHHDDCINFEQHHDDEYSFVFKELTAKCFKCVRTFMRTPNVFEKLESECVSLAPGEEPTVENVCKVTKDDQRLITLFNENYVPTDCRSSLDGIWHFTHQNRFRFTGVCDKPDARINSCQTGGTPNQKFNITYQQCEGIEGTFSDTFEFNCLGDWFVGEKHYFAAVNPKESRKTEKYRCFLKNRDDDLYVGASVTPECNVLRTPQTSPERWQLTPVKPGCR
ncbi:uncharacterized protein LOC132787301 [Drosophila nasuta]|uniref:uncharacterized protein LOC132787301 n=1 Tax=Drosophila nasuta TaxID=42062 RepID=UPI00295F04EA|nr:uncharacterized protein LOC132787301 [Drosophila nasuta]